MAIDNSILQDRQDQSRTRIAASPDYAGAVGEVERYATKLQETSPVPRLKSDVEAKTKELFDFDRQMEGNYDPLAQQRTSMYGAGVVGNPAITERYATGAYGAGAGFASDLLGAVGKYQSLETSALGQILNSVLSVIERQERAKEKEQDRAWETEKFNRQMALEEKKLTSGGTYTERRDIEKQRLLDNIAQDTKNRTTLDDLMKNYGTQVDPDEILRIYNLNAPSDWGTAKETPEELYRKYNIVPPSGAPGVKTAEEKETTKNIIGLMERIRDNVKPGELINPLSENGKYWNSQVQLGTQLIAKLIEKNRLSDSDRVFYLKQTRPDVLDLANPNLYKKKVQGAIDVLKTKLGILPTGITGGSSQIGRFQVEVE